MARARPPCPIFAARLSGSRLRGPAASCNWITAGRLAGLAEGYVGGGFYGVPTKPGNRDIGCRLANKVKDWVRVRVVGYR